MQTMEHSIQDLARLTGVTSRALRHYDRIGLLPPSRIGANGYRYYDRDALLRLQRVLLLRELGLGLSAIAEVLDGQGDHVSSLSQHRQWLIGERARIDKQIASVEITMRKLEEGTSLMAEEMFDGFSQNPHDEEAIRRWGRKAVEDSNRKWRELGEAKQGAVMEEAERIRRELMALKRAGKAPYDDQVQALIADHLRWLCTFWTPNRTAYINLGEMYVGDPRFAAYYNGKGESAVDGTVYLLRDAMRLYAERNLPA